MQSVNTTAVVIKPKKTFVDWLNSKGIEPVFMPRPVPERPPLRPKFIEEVLIFIRAASQLSGVTRIALIGSLTTDEPGSQGR